MKFYYLLFLVCISGYSQNVKYSKAKITYNNHQNLQKLIELGLPMDHGVHKQNVYIISDFSTTEIEAAKKLGLQVDILIDDLSKDFLKRNRAFKKEKAINPNCTTTETSTKKYPTPTNFALGSMGGYLTYQEMLDNLDAMRLKYPKLITARADIKDFKTEGTADDSVSPSIGGNALQWVRISDNPDTDEKEPEILYTAIHHAREPMSLSQLIFYMWYLLENYDSDSEVKQIVDNSELYFIPVINPDGYLFNQKTNPKGGGMWRKNRKDTHGVDLNRNYDYYPTGKKESSIWGTNGVSHNTGSQTFPGAGAFSEVETQAIKWFVEQHEFKIALNNHSHSKLLLFPFGYAKNKPTPDNSIFETISEVMVSENKYRNIISTKLYAASGNSDDFMYGTLGKHDKIFAFTPEIGSAFWPVSSEIEKISKEMMFLNLTASKMLLNYAQIKDTNPLVIGDSPSFEATYSIKRLGINGNGNFKVSILPISANITSVESPNDYTNLKIGSIVENKITINLDNSIKIGDDIEYIIRVEGGIASEDITVTKKFGAYKNIINNQANDLTEYTNLGWSTTTATFVSGPSSITDSPGGNYDKNQNKTIMYSNEIKLADNLLGANVQFNAKWEIKDNFDYVQFQVSTDDGKSWTSQCGKYTNLGENTQPIGEPLYDGSQSNWILEQIDLSDYIGKTIKIRFKFRSDENKQADGFYFDDLKINIMEPKTLDVNENEIKGLRFYPNPFENAFKIERASIDQYDVYIRDIRGNTVHEKLSNIGDQEFDFSYFSTGIYFLSVITESKAKTFKLLKK